MNVLKPVEFRESLTRKDILAIKNVFAGTADAHQQRLAIVAIVNKLSRAHDVLYIPGTDGQRSTDFLNGRAFVGQLIHKYLNIPVGQLPPDEEVNPNEHRR